MASTTWESIYEKTFGNSVSRDWAIGSSTNENQSIKICNAYCNFQLSPWKFEDYITGMSATGAQNLIRINPTVDTITDGESAGTGGSAAKTTKRKKVYSVLWNGDFNSDNPALASYTGGDHSKYDLIDIFIQAPSMFLFQDSEAGTTPQRYDMEAGLVFTNTTRSRYVVMVTPMSLSPFDYTPPKQSVYYGLWQTLNSLAKNIPAFETTISVDLGSHILWTPRMFLPQYDKQAFIRWTDVSNPQVSYILFYSPDSALPIPRSFYNNFVDKLSGGNAKMQQLLAKPGRKMPTGTLLEINENISPQPVEEETKCETVINPVVQATVHQAIKDQESTKPTPPLCDEQKKDPSAIIKDWIIWILAAIIIIIVFGWMIWYYRRKPIDISS